MAVLCLYVWCAGQLVVCMCVRICVHVEVYHYTWALPYILRGLQLKAVGLWRASPLASFFPSFKPLDTSLPQAKLSPWREGGLPCTPAQLHLPGPTHRTLFPQKSLVEGQEDTPFPDLRN